MAYLSVPRTWNWEGTEMAVYKGHTEILFSFRRLVLLQAQVVPWGVCETLASVLLSM